MRPAWPRPLIFVAWLSLSLQKMADATEVVLVESIDWLAVSSAHIALYEVENHRLRNGPATAGAGEFGLRVLQAWKGQPPKHVWLPLNGPMPSTPSAAQVLVFFGADASPDALIALNENAAGSTPTITASFQVLRTRAEILSALDQRLRRLIAEPKANSASVRLGIPAGSEAGRFFGREGAHDVLVPADRELGEALRAQTSAEEDVWARARAAHQLAAFPDAESIQRLIELLHDPATAVVTTVKDGQTIEQRAYPVRQAAYDALLRSSVPVTEPDGYLASFPTGLLTARGALL
jgi:hypothetical protein